jgi:Cu2+-exporting ATPase
LALAETPHPAACPACTATPDAADIRDQAEADVGPSRLQLSLPSVHCAGCISGVERALNGVPGVISARVNLTLKRASVEAAPGVSVDALIERLALSGYEAHELDATALSATETDRTGRDLAMRLAVAFFANMNVMLLSVAVWAGASDATRDMFHWISGAIAIPAVIFAGVPFYRSAWSALKGWRLNMDVPISLALILALSLSLWETQLSGHHAYFDAALSLVFFLLLGRYLDHKTRASARSAAEELTALEVPKATRLAGGDEFEVYAAELAVGDLVRVRPGGRVPVDGIVIDGSSEIDRSLMTGESLPVFAGPDTAVSAGEVNLTGPLTVRVTAAGRDTSLHQIADLVAVAEAGRSNYNSLADRAARAYAPVVHILAFGAFGAWMWVSGGDLRLSLNVAVATLIITCPCALGLAVPAVTAAASGRLFRKGLLIKDGTALERLAEVDTVVFDKTGTLTMGAPVPLGLNDLREADLRAAFALASGSSHPLAVSLADACEAMHIDPVRTSGLQEVPGYGVEASVGGLTARLGRASWVGAVSGDRTATYLRIGDAKPVCIEFTDGIRPGALDVITNLKSSGAKIILLSGDNDASVRAISRRFGIEDSFSDALPAEKAARVQALVDEGRKVLMVGDGLNDTAAMSAAHVSISPASALDAARVASDVVLLGNDLSPITDALETARRAKARIKENFALSTVYNIVAVPIALLGFATPFVAAIAMSASSITVSLNALRVR